MNDVKEQLTQLGVHILSQSRNELYLSMRYLDIALFSLQFDLNLSTKTIGTDGKSILFNPRYLMETYSQDPVLVNRAYLHILLHNLFCHDFTRGNKNKDCWNLACDIAAESIIDSMSENCVHLTTSDYRSYVYARLRESIQVLNAQSIYHVLQNTFLSQQEFDRMCQAFRVDDHQFWDHDKENGPDDRQKQNEQQNTWQKMSEKVQTNLQTLSRQYGDQTGNLLENLKLEHRERSNFREFLRRFANWGEEIVLDADSFDYAYYEYGIEHYGNMPLMEPLEYRETKKIDEFVIAVDTSESCPIDMVRSFLNLTISMLMDRENFFKKVRVHIIQCDTEVKKDTVVTDRDEWKKFLDGFEVRGSGGTDFRPVFTYTESLIQKGEFRHLKGLIYFTDGIGEYPKKPPSFETAFIFLEKEYADVPVPSWAMKIILTQEDRWEQGIGGEGEERR